MNQRPPPNVWPVPLTDGAFFVDNSSQEYMMTCKRAAGYYLAHKREGNKSKAAQEFGKILHKALEHRYKSHGSYLGAAATQEMADIVEKEFQTFTPEDGEFRNFGVAISAIKKYSTSYQLEEFEPYKFPDGSLFVERVFAFPLGTIKIDGMLWIRNPDGTVIERYVDEIQVVQKGKIDLCYRREGRLYGMDHKSTSIMGPQYFAEFELASQIHCYSKAIKVLTGELPSGYVINGLGIRKPTPSGKPLEFIRQTIPIYPALVEEWEHDTMQLVGEFVEGCRTNQLPKGTKWCVGKYGHCQYRQVCGLEPHLREMSLYSNEYRDVTWDPLKE